ncbi:hypothetical protein [Streptomyces sp. NBC_01174]|uniref:hypothetical protein n=1 Tax=Streptomyces sp. NBC_01174 TaxID=2903758 RepID=UPI00386687A9|nr:hypothetical protein OG491_00060 [Streptomyces sp. NBC_01175]WSS73287.1 hypothetical protein OG491_35860 [Streptomyces sp. NBC_01175]WSS73765.1 hypothetical protein OG414_00050 [Streptomyces sp. NBC_01174]WSS80827.1 hypothetical protein OG414_39165 [Streptomyces sp. NBC_01174]
MADSGENRAVPSGAPESKPPSELAGNSDQTPSLLGRKVPIMEQAYWTLGVAYYGAHVTYWMWMRAQEQVLPLVQQYV